MEFLKTKLQKIVLFTGDGTGDVTLQVALLECCGMGDSTGNCYVRIHDVQSPVLSPVLQNVTLPIPSLVNYSNFVVKNSGIITHNMFSCTGGSNLALPGNFPW